MTTRILARRHRAQVYGGAPDRHRLLARLAEPGSAQSGYLVEGRREAAARLRAGRPRAAARADGLLAVDAIAITHFHLDHWGDLVPWAWLNAYGRGAPDRLPRAVAPAGRSRQLDDVRRPLGQPAMFESLRARRVRARRAVRGRRLRGRGVLLPHYDLEAFGFRVRDPGRHVLAYSGDSRPDDGARRARARRRSLPLRGDARRRHEGRATLAATCPRRRRSQLPTARSSSRTARSSCRRPTACPSRRTVSSSRSRPEPTSASTRRARRCCRSSRSCSARRRGRRSPRRTRPRAGRSA